MLRSVLLLATALPAFSQFHFIDIAFDGVGCASCVESLPPRMKRIRGVDSATVDPAAGRLTLKLAPENRVHIEQIRDAIAQDGSKPKSARVEISGTLVLTEGKWTLTAPSLRAPYSLDPGDHAKQAAKLVESATPVHLTGEVAALTPNPIVIRVTALRAR